MKPIETLGRDKTPEGDDLVLSRRDGIYLLTVEGQELMCSRAHGSEDALASRACAEIADRKRPRVLIGGLGFGYTLRAALDRLPAKARVVVCEVFPCLLEWNRTLLAHLAGRPLEDPRVTAVQADVWSLLAGADRFDAILLDVDNGPEAFTLRSNQRFYKAEGLERLERILTDGGVLAVWSASPSPEFEKRLRRTGLEAWTERVSARGDGGKRSQALFLARRRR